MESNKLTNYELVTIAVSNLGGDTNFIDREDVAIEVNNISAGRFNWRKYPDRIDLDSVGIALRDAKKARNGGLITGDNTSGWMLTSQGLQWVKSLASIQDLPLSESNRIDSMTSNQEAECARLRSTKAYILYQKSEVESITLQDFYQFTRLNEYFQSKARKRRFAIIENSIKIDPVLSNLWDILKEKFKGEMISDV